jgi:hypothetical protein
MRVDVCAQISAAEVVQASWLGCRAQLQAQKAHALYPTAAAQKRLSLGELKRTAAAKKAMR